MDFNVPFFVFGLFYLVWITIFFIRVNQVFNLRKRLIDEEYEWLRGHLGLFSGEMLRIRSLPPSWLWILKFWVPVSSLGKEVKPVDQYYTGVVR